MKIIDGRTKLYALFASPCEHSLSPLIQNTAFKRKNINAVYLAFNVDKTGIENAINSMRTLGIAGVNVSMPNKTEIIQYLDEVSDEAKFCNAVNTVVNKDGRLFGYNTDVYGAQKSIESLGIEIKNSNITLIGLGGAGQAVLYALAKNNARKISVFVRNESMDKRTDVIEKFRSRFMTDLCIFSLEDSDLLSKEIYKSDLLVNSTSLGMGPSCDKSPLNDEIKLPENISVMDVVYEPRETKLLRKAKEDNCRAYTNGLSMLIYQGAMAFKYFTGEDVTISEIIEAVDNDVFFLI